MDIDPNVTNAFGVHGLRWLQRDDEAERFSSDENARRWVIEKLGEADPETIAFVAIGAIERWRERSETPEGQAEIDRACDRLGGQVGVIAEVVSYARVLDALYPKYADRFGAVFAYEVAEPFGAWLFDRMLDGDSTYLFRVEQKAHELLKAGCF